MMGMINQALGSGAYVALEQITGKLDGREGSFCGSSAGSVGDLKN